MKVDEFIDMTDRLSNLGIIYAVDEKYISFTDKFIKNVKERVNEIHEKDKQQGKSCSKRDLINMGIVASLNDFTDSVEFNDDLAELGAVCINMYWSKR